jgi:hypothetical protein
VNSASDVATRLVDQHERERQEHSRKVEEGRGRRDPGELRDHRHRGVPERERVTGVQAPVAELVERAQRQVVHREQLLCPREVEERVAVVACDPPERDSADEAEPEHPERPRGDAVPTPRREGRRDECGRE